MSSTTAGALSPVDRFFEFSLLGLLTSGYLAVVGSGYLDMPTMLLTAGAVVLIPRAPLLLITLFVQVIAVTLLPAALVFLILLLNDRAAVGEYCNTRRQNLIGTLIVVSIVVLSTLYGISVMFPKLIE